jgi:hypothetical protein
LIPVAPEVVTDPVAISFVSQALVQPIKPEEQFKAKPSRKSATTSPPDPLPKPQLSRAALLVAVPESAGITDAPGEPAISAAAPANMPERRPSRALLAQLAAVP